MVVLLWGQVALRDGSPPEVGTCHCHCHCHCRHLPLPLPLLLRYSCTAGNRSAISATLLDDWHALVCVCVCVCVCVYTHQVVAMLLAEYPEAAERPDGQGDYPLHIALAGPPGRPILPVRCATRAIPSAPLHAHATHRLAATRYVVDVDVVSHRR